jgi:hypothetical protein
VTSPAVHTETRKAGMSTPQEPPREAPDASVAHLRIPPHSVEAEQSILGGLLLDSSAFAEISDVVSATDFFRHEHRLLFGAIAKMVAAGEAVDAITLHEHLEGEAIDYGGLLYLASLSCSVPSAANIKSYAAIVRERAVLRRLIAATDEIATQAFSGRPSDELLDDAKEKFGRISLDGKLGTRRVPLLKLADLREQSQAVHWVIKHVLPAESIGMLFGASGTFKSFIALDAALHIVHGLPWLGRKTEKGAVLYIAAEGGSGLWKRIAAWHRARRIPWADAKLYVVPVALDLQADAWRVVEAAQSIGETPSLVIVDTLSQTYAGEENSAAEMAAYLRELGIRFRQLWQCAVMLIHHTGHTATERPRGSSAMRANLDWMYGVFRDEREMLATLTCLKQKDGDTLKDQTFSLAVHDLGNDSDGDPVTSLVARHLTSAEDVQDAMETERKAGRSGHRMRFLQLAQNGSKEADLRSAFYRDCGLDTPEARKKAYQRARDWAVESGFVDIAEGYVITLKGTP